MSDTPANDTLLIWGAGAIGGTIGAYLARAGHDVLMVDQVAEHVAAMRGDGLRIEGPLEEFRIRLPAATPDEVQGQFGRILLAVKAHHTEAATRQLLPHLAPGGYVASFQNGLNEYTIGAQAGMERVIGAFINFGADYLDPGRILYGGRGACVLGEMDGNSTDRLRALHAVMHDFDRDAITTDNILGYLWGKLGYGALLFATALTDSSIADVFAMQRHWPLLTAVGREPMAVAAAANRRPLGFNGFDPAAFAPGGPAEAVADSLRVMEAHNRRSAKSHSGIWRDLAVRRRPTEVDAQLGPVVETGAQHGVPTPVTARLVAMIHQIERSERALSEANLAELAGAMREPR